MEKCKQKKFEKLHKNMKKEILLKIQLKSLIENVKTKKMAGKLKVE
jgi:hypothetical protein